MYTCMLQKIFFSSFPQKFKTDNNNFIGVTPNWEHTFVQIRVPSFITFAESRNHIGEGDLDGITGA
jgi:hypothetical protein